MAAKSRVVFGWLLLGASCALGLYAVCPGDPNYIIGSPLFDRATLSLPNNKTFTIVAKNNGTQHPYIHAATLNGQPFNRTYLSHQEVAAGGELAFEMVSAQDYKWAAGPEGRPPSAMPGR